MPNSALPPLIQALTDPSRYSHPADRIRVLQTHISWVILTGPFAYKIKKPLNLGFLNFTDLDRRRFFCEEELRLNRRLAPEIYLDLVSITGTPDAPELGGRGPAIEYAVRMKEFPQEAQLDRVLARGALEASHIDALVDRLAAFHAEIPKVPADGAFGTSDRIAKPVFDNFEAIQQRIDDPEELAGLERLELWTRQAHRDLSGEFERRRRSGFVRECHGDVHLANMALVEGKVVIFDCIEFSENLRWIDVISEVAFLTMDLEDRGRPDYARRALNRYLELTGDYSGLRLLRYYQAYRAMVRAKVTSIRLGQPGIVPAERDKIRREYRDYEALAESYSRPVRTWLAIMHGLSGSGKTTVAQGVLDRTGAIRIRTDVERKRLFGLPPTARTSSGIESGLYTKEASQRTYQAIAGLAGAILGAGFPVIADGTFLTESQRRLLRSVAERAGVPFVILNVQASEPALVRRLEERAHGGEQVSEADLAVLRRQIAARDPMEDADRAVAVIVQTEPPSPVDEILRRMDKITQPGDRL